MGRVLILGHRSTNNRPAPQTHLKPLFPLCLLTAHWSVQAAGGPQGQWAQKHVLLHGGREWLFAKLKVSFSRPLGRRALQVTQSRALHQPRDCSALVLNIWGSLVLHGWTLSSWALIGVQVQAENLL